VPAKLYYRLNLDRLFKIMDEEFDPTPSPNEEEDGVNSEPTSQDVQNAHPRMSKTRILECTDPPIKDARSRQTRLADPAELVCTDPPDKIGGSRQSNTKNTTKTTTKITTETTTTTETPSALAPEDVNPVDVVVDVRSGLVPERILHDFQELLGTDRAVNDADLAALADLAEYPDHIVENALKAARAWLSDPAKGPIHALARWLVDTAQRKEVAERQRGNSVASNAEMPTLFNWEEYLLPDQEETPSKISPENKLWQQVLAELALQIPSATYNAWLHDTWLIASTGDEYQIGVPTAQARDWLAYRMTEIVQRTLGRLVGQPVNVHFQVAAMSH
jgi:hypothetical protein